MGERHARALAEQHAGEIHLLVADVVMPEMNGRELAKRLLSSYPVAVQQMVEASVEHAFEDLAARRWVEARLKANELITATRKGVANCADELEVDYQAQLETAVREGRMTYEESGRLLKFYEEGLGGYTYLE